VKILKIKKMSKGRYKVTFDNNSDLVLYEEVIVNNIILVGKNIGDELYEKIISDNYKAMPYHLSLDYINTRMRSREEIKNYLLKKKFDECLIDEVLLKLEKEGYIDDLAFAKAYVSDKLNLSYDGLGKIRIALSNFKIREDIINEALLNIEDDLIGERIDKLIVKQKKLKNKYTGNMLKNKILNYLINLGYDRNQVLDKLNNQAFNSNTNIEKEYQKLYKKYSKKYSGYKLDMTIKQHLYQRGYDLSEVDNFEK
jgi:regulatory protein